MKKISEVAKLLKTSRQTIYNKIDKLNLHEFLTVTEDGKKLNDEGIEKIRESLAQVNDSLKQVNEFTNTRLVDTLMDNIKRLEKMIEEKDKQIERFQIILSQNNQLLLENKEKKKWWSWSKK